MLQVFPLAKVGTQLQHTKIPENRGGLTDVHLSLLYDPSHPGEGLAGRGHPLPCLSVEDRKLLTGNKEERQILTVPGIEKNISKIIIYTRISVNTDMSHKTCISL